MTTAHESTEFREFVARLRRGDESAAAELVAKYEPIVRREVRLHLEDSRLSRLFESADFSQSVFASFLFRAMAGEYQLDDSRQLVALLFTMARNKFASKARWLHRNKRDIRRHDDSPAALDGMPAAEDSPSQVVSAAELVARCRETLSDDERRIIELRGQQKSWKEIGELLGSSPDAVRVRLQRATERVARQFGLHE